VVTATDAAGVQVSSEPIPAVTVSADELDTLEAEVIDPDRMEPGVTMMDLGRFLVILDQEGEIVWWWENPGGLGDARRLANGNLLVVLYDSISAVEIDMLGNVINRWSAANVRPIPDGAIAVAADGFHHEVGELASGDLVALSSELRSFDDYPTSVTDPTPREQPTNLVGDVVVVFGRDGSTVHSYSLLDLLDPYRYAYDSFTTFFWMDFYPGMNGLDWAHANAVVEDPTDGGLVVSLRHQDAVVKIDATGALAWILGPHDNWSPDFQPYLLTPIGEPFAWQYHQHSPELTPAGTLLLFDNGNFGASPPAPALPDRHSRAVEYAIDEETMEVRQVWEYDAGGTVFSAIVGDADHLPITSNVLVHFGGAPFSGGIGLTQEVTRDEPPEVVFEVRYGRVIYRAERLPSLYP
jgi:arylsulfate sulfotransferase